MSDLQGNREKVMCKELNDIFDSLSADHKNDLLVIAKSMKKIETLNSAFENVLNLAMKEVGIPTV